MFGNKSLPSKIYAYGAKAPVLGLDLVDDQMRRAHRYRNALVALELMRRKKINRAVTAICPELTEVEAKIAALRDTREKAREEIMKARVEARKKVRPEGLVLQVREAGKALKELGPVRKALREKTFKSDAWKAEQDRIELWNKNTHKKMRAVCGLYWGTYLHVEGTVDHSGPPPQFQRWEGKGHIAVQIQHGLTPAELFAGGDTRLRVDPVPAEAWLPGGRHLRKTKVHFRIGTNEDRSPIFATVPFVLHRPFPEDCQIKWFHLIRRKISTKFEWSAQFVLSRESWTHEDASKTGAAGIDVGWRVRDDGSLRTAYWIGDDGSEGEVVLPAGWMSEMKKTRDLQSIRKVNFNGVHERLVKWSKEAKTSEWWKEATPALDQWKSQQRMAVLVVRWRDNRFAGDEEMFKIMEDWRKRYLHLYEYENNLRDQLQNFRKDLYRKFAAGLRRSFKTAVVEKLTLTEFHELPEPEETPENEIMRENTRNACLSELLTCVKESMTQTVAAPPEFTTMRCHMCGHVEDFDRVRLVRQCTECKNEEDQDRTAAINLLRTALPDFAPAGSSAPVV